MIVALLGMVGLVVDIGHVYICQRELQAACDASALAGAAVIPTSTTSSAVLATAANFDAAGTGNNTYANLPNVTLVSGYPQLKCLTTMQLQGISCVGYLPYNSIQVKLQAPIPMYFARLIGKTSMTISASSTAAKGGGSSKPYNIVIMLDTTLSMNNFDSDCGATQMTCSLQGLQVLLNYLDPCGTSQAMCTITAGNSANSVVRISLFTFPNLTSSTVQIDSYCTNALPAATAQNGYSYSPTLGTYVMPPANAWSGIATAASYSFPLPLAPSYPNGTGFSAVPANQPTSVTYQVTPFVSDYRVSDFSTTLNPTSVLTQAVGGAPGCGGMQPANYAGVYGTYYAATIYAAQAALVQQALINPGSQNVLIILGDGDANSPQNKRFLHLHGPWSHFQRPLSLLERRVRTGHRRSRSRHRTGHYRLYGRLWFTLQRLHHGRGCGPPSQHPALQRDGPDRLQLLELLLRFQAVRLKQHLRSRPGRHFTQRHLPPDRRRPHRSPPGLRHRHLTDPF